MSVMKHKSPQHYRRLLRAQKTIKARDEAELASLKQQLGLIAQENEMLADMLANGSYADFVQPLLISQRIERNHRTQAKLTAALDEQTKLWLQSNKRAEHVSDKYAKAQALQEREHHADLLGEYIGTQSFLQFKK